MDEAEKLIAQLKDQDLHVRYKAAEALVKIGKPAVPALIEALKCKRKGVQGIAAETLGRIGDPSAVHALTGVLKKGPRRVRQNAAEALGKIGDSSAVPALIGVLNDNDWRVRFNAAEALFKMGGPPAIPQLIEALKESSDNAYRHMSERAEEMLVEIGKPAVPLLIKTLNNEIVRWKAAGMLGKIGDPKAVPALIAVLNREYHRAGDRASYSFEAVLAPSYAPSSYLQNESRQYGDSEFRGLVAKVLGEIGDITAVRALIQGLKEKNGSLWLDIVWALEDIGMVPALIDALKDKSLDIQRGAARVLENIIVKCGSTGQIQDFETKLQDGYERMKKKYRKEDLTDVQVQIAKVKMAIAKKKNELAEDKGVLLDDKPKPPKKEMYQQIRRLRNG